MARLEKPDAFASAFEIVNCAVENAGETKCSSCGHPIEEHGERVVVSAGVKFDGEELPTSIRFSAPLAPGVDYAISLRDGELHADVAPRAGALGGFHVGLDGKIVKASRWDQNFRPRCVDPRGMALIAGLFWCDIYPLNSEPRNGTSRPHLPIADRDAKVQDGLGGEKRLNWWTATEVLAAHGKDLLSRAEFELMARGVTEGLNAGEDPVKTGHIPGLRSAAGIEMATGCMWTWSRDRDEDDWCYLMGGCWGSRGSGPRAFHYSLSASISGELVGARGRGDHLIIG